MRFLRHLTSWISITLLLSTFSKADDDEHQKRVPSGFTGVRGKKSISNEAYDNEDNSFQPQPEVSPEAPPTLNYLTDKRAPSGFFGMRGKKPWTYPEELYKRTPMGFVGMRGKKENDDIFDDASKRAQMGFFGMRGKKFWPAYQGDKRAPMGFIGMRGKKDFENPEGYFEDSKRAPSGFFGMRGKKQPSGFFGMRGKKYPYEFRGKFVGVRGKKSTDITVPTSYYQDLNQPDDLDINQLMLLLTEQNADSSQ